MWCEPVQKFLASQGGLFFSLKYFNDVQLFVVSGSEGVKRGEFWAGRGWFGGRWGSRGFLAIVVVVVEIFGVTVVVWEILEGGWS